MVSPLAAVFVGSDTLLLQCLEAWQERGHRVAAVATDTDKVRRYCAENGLRCVAADERLAATLAGDACDVLFAITWLKLLSPDVLALPKRCAINFHDGPLPRYAGLNATCWALHGGENEHGVTWHVLEPKADTGDILLQRTFAIAADDTAFTLNARCFEHGVASFGELAQQLADDRLERRPQDLSQRTWFARSARPAGLGVLDFQQPAEDVARLVRAFDHGGYQNPVAVAKVRTAHGVFVPSSAALADGGSASGKPAGTVVQASPEEVVVACGNGADVRLLRPQTLSGKPLAGDQLAQLGVAVGVVLPAADTAQLAAWTDLGVRSGQSEAEWLRLLEGTTPLPVPDAEPSGAAAAPVLAEIAAEVPGGDAEHVAATIAAFLLRNAGTLQAAVGFCDRSMHAGIAAVQDLAVPCPPLPLQAEKGVAVDETRAAIREAMQAARRRGPLLRDVAARRSDAFAAAGTLAPPVRIVLGLAEPLADTAGSIDAGSMQFVVSEGGAVRLCFDSATIREESARALVARLQAFARAAAADGGRSLVEVPVLDEAELRRLLQEFNDTDAPKATEPCLHRQFMAMAQRLPDRTALISGTGGEQLSYRELLLAADRLAGYLRARGVADGDRVGICTARGFGMVTAALAVMRCGAAYVPLDPSYPKDRLQFMAEDAELAALVVDAASAQVAPAASCPRVDLDGDREQIAAADVLLDAASSEGAIAGEQLAYLIYTSGSTGRPKGVMVRHRNAANFFVGMDRVLGADQAEHEPGTWLAVTSLSFDISVLELLWTLCRGYTVVLHAPAPKGEDEAAAGGSAGSEVPSTRPISFSMFYFASDEGEHADDKYRLLMEGARFADQNGFEAVWTPERHFHAFGGLYPNPAVASAAIAAVTENVHIRAGSCVATLHHPIRIAEDWSLVDNLSRGRVGIAFAAGWHARDFVLRPESFADRKNVMAETMQQVQALWQGQSLEFAGHDGKMHEIRTLPRPIQKKLPMWVTVAGNPETFRMAGESGSNVLTHLLGQSLDELKEKLRIYREARRAAGHPGDGQVTLMLHTYVGDDDSRVREIVRGPMKEYLRSSLDLVKQAAWSFPAFKNRVDKPGEMDELLNGGLTPEDFEALLDFSFERYYQQSGLFGTPETCVAQVDRLRGIEVDEIACLVDFGVPTELMMQSLPHLLELKRRCDTTTAAAGLVPAAAGDGSAEPAASIPELIQRHGVTHFQCTPSMAGMLLLDPAAPAALAGLRSMLVGGEALPDALAVSLRRHVSELHNVYGPTETTVWSTTSPVAAEGQVRIGRPLLNQQVYVLDNNLQPVAIGSVGELWIGGDGVTAGYFRRPELTEERFRPDPFVGETSSGRDGKIYGTGDLVRFGQDGVLEYLGRKDLQVKVRGYRIELGEIETALGKHAAVREAVVVAIPGTDVGDQRLVAYYVSRSSAPSVDQLREHLRQSLPEFMVPSHFVAMADLPRTPNLKVDRKALPAPEAVMSSKSAGGKAVLAAAADDTEDAILQIWRQSLGTDDVGVEDNFFDSGGHSILAVKVHREIVQQLSVQLQVTDLFRFTTVRALAKHLQVGKSEPTAAQKAMERAKGRRRNLQRRT